MDDLKLNAVEFIDWADRYLIGELTIDETTQFEKLLENNPAFFAKIEEHQKLIDAMALHQNRTKLVAELEALHSNYKSELNAAQPNFINDLDVAEPKIKILKPYRIYLAAASIAILVSVGAISSYNFFQTKNSNSGFRALKRDLEKIKKSQHAIITNINNNAKEDIAVERFGGTGFALTSTGYIITSYHLIKGNDSVFIENAKVGRLKAIEVYSNPATDISVLKIQDSNFDGFGNLPYTFASNGNMLGEKVYTLGFPREDVVYGEGSISSESGYDGDTAAYQISIPVNPGNSGGPLVDEKGNIVGLISGKQTETEGAAFAIKSNCILQSVSELKDDTAFTKLILNKKNTLKNLPRVQQLNKLKDYVFVVKVFNKN